jgi:16S rRNA processing protein RimM
MSSDPTARQKLIIGRLGSPKGVGGGLKIHSYSGEFEHFLDLKEVDLEPGSEPGQLAKPQAASTPRKLRLKVRHIEASAGGLVMAFEGYPSPETARSLTGLDIVVDREAAAPLGDNEWYVGDLVGVDLMVAGKKVGSVESVLHGGPESWLETRLDDKRLVIVPLRKEFVGAVDLAARTIELIAPWLLDE